MHSRVSAVNPNLWHLTWELVSGIIIKTTEKTVAWQRFCLEAFAEQDNRVRFPDGTAAVCADDAL